MRRGGGVVCQSLTTDLDLCDTSVLNLHSYLSVDVFIWGRCVSQSPSAPSPFMSLTSVHLPPSSHFVFVAPA